MRYGALGVLIALVLSGCGGKVESTDDVSQEPIEVAPGIWVAPDRGVVQGKVFSDAGLVVPDATVILVESITYIKTGQGGAFLFENVTPGAQVLRVEAPGFQVHERTIEVSAADLLEINVTLLPADLRGTAYRPHVHDLWRGEQSVTIMDEEVLLADTAEGPLGIPDELVRSAWANVYHANTGAGRFPIMLPSDGDVPALVYPGTGQIDVTLSWSGAGMPGEFAVSYVPANSDDETILDPGASGTVWSIPVTPEMVDNGHQVYSLWTFNIRTTNNVVGGDTPAIADDPIHVTITLHRGADTPVEPGHPSFWEEGDVLVLLDGVQKSHAAIWSSNNQGGATIKPEQGVIVPPGAARMRMEFSYAYADPTGTPADIEYTLKWKTAVGDPQVIEPRDYETTEYVTEGDVKVFEIVLEPEDLDGFYQQKSGWRWMPWPEEEIEENGLSLAGNRERVFTLTVTVFREGSEVL